MEHVSSCFFYPNGCLHGWHLGSTIKTDTEPPLNDKERNRLAFPLERNSAIGGSHGQPNLVEPNLAEPILENLGLVQYALFNQA